MTSESKHPNRVDAATLLDWAAGRLPASEADRVRAAIAADPQLANRADAVRKTLGLLDHHRVEQPGDDLGDRIRVGVRAARARPGNGSAGDRRSRWAAIFSLREVAAVAAALLLMFLVFFPSTQKARFAGQQARCADSLRVIGVALEQYANEHSDMLPYMQLSGNWLNREGGQSATGTAPLFLLLRQQRLQPRDLICAATDDAAFAGNAAEDGLVDFPDSSQCSYSFQNLFGSPQPLRHRTPTIVPVLADRNPWFRGGQFNGDVGGHGNSHNHGSDTGQNVLFNDGRVHWLDRPEVGLSGDNIWLAGNRRSYTGTETAPHPGDAFLAP